MVVARPGGYELAGSVRGSSACWPFTCLEAVPPVVVTGHLEHVSRGRASVVAPDLALAPILPATRVAGHLATPFVPQLTPTVSRRWLRSGGEDAIQDCVRPAHRVAARRPRAVQNRRPRARTPPGRFNALATGGAQGSRRSSWKGCRLRQLMTTRSDSVSVRRSMCR